MVIVEYKNKNANHGLWVNGHRISFVNGEAKISEDDAKAIAALKDPNYKIIIPKKPKAKKAKSKLKK